MHSNMKSFDDMKCTLDAAEKPDGSRAQLAVSDSQHAPLPKVWDRAEATAAVDAAIASVGVVLEASLSAIADLRHALDSLASSDDTDATLPS